MRTLNSVIVYLAVVLLAVACAAVTPAKSTESAPSWLRMKPGYAEQCIQDGGCTPMSDRELQELVAVIQARTLEWCRANSI